ncbi:PREDICTED: protein RADIALIS-like 1 [Tarenaya hassleriana]|uniref:protein RADIALIS-like 1 n=1 Tax=Tarenaya hassleriana TaxID=28532 RepID=UPI0008FD3E66|nr:PREDICTED: protein RADIALIS-like 1 [Tarenaya hassleriana]
MSSQSNSDQELRHMYSLWTADQNKRFENALADMYDSDSPDRWKELAEAVGDDKTIEDIILHYEELVEDLKMIESGHIPLPNYANSDHFEQDDE